MKSFLFVLLFVFFIGSSAGQSVTGKIVDAITGEALAYVNIGVIGLPRGTTTDENGIFTLKTAELTDNTTVRISMIGYVAQTFTIGELLGNNGKTIKLENTPVLLSEVVIKPGKLKTRQVGSTKYLSNYSWAWGGIRGEGHELGLKIELGEAPVFVKSLHICFQEQWVDSCLFRLHVRKIVNELPDCELLTQNIYIQTSKKAGWLEIDLSKYRLVFQGDIVLSLEWVADKGGNPDGKESVVLFKKSKNQGLYYTRMGSEAQWTRKEESGPCFYLTVYN